MTKKETARLHRILDRLLAHSTPPVERTMERIARHVEGDDKAYAAWQAMKDERLERAAADLASLWRMLRAVVGWSPDDEYIDGIVGSAVFKDPYGDP